MADLHGITGLRKFRGVLLTGILSCAVAACGGDSDAASAGLSAGTLTSVTMASTTAALAMPMYGVTNLAADGESTPRGLNDSGQVAFNRATTNGIRAFFYNGASVVPLPVLPGAVEMRVRALSNSGQVAGVARYADNSTRVFSWTQNGGLVDVGTLGGNFAYVADVSDTGQIVGQSLNAQKELHAFSWTRSGGMRDLGTLGGNLSSAHAVSGAGHVVGEATLPGSGIEEGQGRAFLWTQAGGMINLQKLPDFASIAQDVNDSGQVTGSLYRGFSLSHAFSWTAAGGMIDLGTLGGSYSDGLAINSAGQITGTANTGDEFTHAFMWDKVSGMVDLGTLGGFNSSAADINAFGQIAGGTSNAAGDERAFLWSKVSGMVDLNTRLSKAPAGLQLLAAIAISDQGQILAQSNAGLMLLKPGLNNSAAPAIGPIASDDAITLGSTLTVSASFTDADTADGHTASWTWGDGSPAQAGKVTERTGTGSVTGSHIYSTAGVYAVTLLVTDSSGNSTEAKREIVVVDNSGGFVGGLGWVDSPKGAYLKRPGISGRASFRFASVYQRGASTPSTGLQFRFPAANLTFEARQADWLVFNGDRAQFQGSGRLNGAGNYHFRVTAININGREKDRLRIQIWHYDTAKKTDVTDYDNQSASGGEGSTVSGGNIVIHK